MVDYKQIIEDVVLIVKILFLSFYYNAEAFFKQFLPAKYLNKDVQGQIVLITGGANGIGKIVAQKMLALGCVVVIIDIDQKNLKIAEEQLKRSVGNQANRVFTYSVDLTSRDAIKSLANKVRDEVGDVNILINNAGTVNQGKLFVDLNDRDITKIFDVNIMAQIWTCKEFLPAMIAKNQGHVVNVASICGIIGGYKLTDYCATKFAVNGFSESLRLELNTVNPANQIVVSVVCPFHIRTNLFHGVEFSKLKWLNLSMEPEFVAQNIVDGILANKDLIFVPKFQTSFFVFTRYLFSTKAMHVVQTNLDLNGSMDKLKSKAN